MTRLRSVPGWAWLVGLVASSAVLRYWAASRIPIPWILPDETIYAELGKSLYATGKLELLGEPVRFYGLVTPAIVGLPLSLDDLDDGYRALKAIHAVVISLAAVPVFLWTRTLATERWALAAAVLTLAIPDLAYSGLIMTEVAFYPVVVLAAWAMAEALVRPTLARQAAVVGAIVLASATRLQAAVLIPAFFAALLLHLGIRRRRLAQLVSYWPTAAAFVAIGVVWAITRLRGGAPASELLGAYRAAGEADYGFRDALRFVAYHAADVVLLTGLVPVCAVALLAIAGRRSERLRAYLAVTVAISIAMTALVGVFASRHVGHLAERNLFALAPIFFVGLAAWLSNGAPRPRVATAAVGLIAVGLLAALPVGRLVSAATIVDSFTLIPLYRLSVRSPDANLDLLVVVVGVAAAAALFVPQRRLWAVPLALTIAFAAASVSASRVVAARATLGQPGTVGANPRWVDEAGTGDAVYVYTGDVFWTSVWETVFWNRRVRRVYDLLEAQVPGPMPQVSVGPYEDGRLVDKTGAEVPADYVVASETLRFVGRRVASAGNSISLWRVERPLRLAQWTQNVRFDRTVEGQARVVVYACGGGRLELRLRAAAPRTVVIRRNDRPYRRRQLAAGETWQLDVPAAVPRPRGRRLCSFDVLTDGPVLAARLFYRPS